VCRRRRRGFNESGASRLECCKRTERDECSELRWCMVRRELLRRELERCRGRTAPERAGEVLLGAGSIFSMLSWRSPIGTTGEWALLDSSSTSIFAIGDDVLPTGKIDEEAADWDCGLDGQGRIEFGRRSRCSRARCFLRRKRNDAAEAAAHEADTVSTVATAARICAGDRDLCKGTEAEREVAGEARNSAADGESEVDEMKEREESKEEEEEEETDDDEEEETDDDDDDDEKVSEEETVDDEDSDEGMLEVKNAEPVERSG